MTQTPAGRNWCALYPGSRDTRDLAHPFRGYVEAFLDELRENGCTVSITQTLRPIERAYLMHWAWRIARDGVDPKEVDPFSPPIPILWTREGAEEMCRTYRLVVLPSLTSHHIRGIAIDMKITGWEEPYGTLENLYAAGERHKVKKLRRDPPHWSIDGR